MHEKLVAKAFEKVKKKEKEELDIDLSDTPTSDYLSIILKDDYGVKFSDRSLRDVYNGIKHIRKPDVILALCKFLDFKDYQDFLKKQKLILNDFGDSSNPTNVSGIETTKSTLKDFWERVYHYIKKYKILIISFIIIFILALTIIYFSIKQRWMIWKVDRYVEVSFNTKKYEIDQLKLYKEERIKHFKKIKLNCDYTFFDKEGNPKIWYGKNVYGDLQLFTSFGLHPETGATLKPISYYMINKYICN